VEHRGEVTGMANVFGAAVTDVDSIMDSDAHNDAVVNNVIDNSGGDEDDHDVETVSVAP
jgi:hypothetical protein